jgi:hypothetical protein
MANEKISQLEPIGTIDINQDSIPIVDYSENVTKRTNLANIGQRVLEGSTTTNLAEGTNLYFTNTRVYTKVKASLIAGSNTSITFNDALQTITIASEGNVQSVNGQTGEVVLDTDDIEEGASNLYYTNARFDDRLATKSTDDLTEGDNLYYTDARVDAVLIAEDVTKQGNTFNSAEQLVKLDASGKLPAVDGSNLTNLPIPPPEIVRHDFNVFDYLGKAASGSSESANVWTITRLTIASNGSTTKGVATNVNWTDRYTHIYS